MSVVKCKRCGSADVEVKTWVNANTGEVTSLSDMDSLIKWKEDCFCKDCGETSELIIEASKESNANLLDEIESLWDDCEPDNMEIITGLRQEDIPAYICRKAYEDACNKLWNSKTDEEKIAIYRTIRYGEN